MDQRRRVIPQSEVRISKVVDLSEPVSHFLEVAQKKKSRTLELREYRNFRRVNSLKEHEAVERDLKDLEYQPMAIPDKLLAMIRKSSTATPYEIGLDTERETTIDGGVTDEPEAQETIQPADVSQDREPTIAVNCMLVELICTRVFEGLVQPRQYHSDTITELSNRTSALTLDCLKGLNQPLKWIVLVTLTPCEPHSGLHITSACRWDVEADLAASIFLENDTLRCSIEAFGLQI